MDKDELKRRIKQDLKTGNKKPTSIIASIACHSCKHLDRTHKPMVKFCRAFPEGIPEEIRTGKLGHLEHVTGDHGIKYEPLDDKLDVRNPHN